MSSLKQLKTEQKRAEQQLHVLEELQTLVGDIERAENSIIALKSELEAVNVKHQGRQTTREDIAYLTDLLKCANKKLAWEKQINSLQKRTPTIMDRMTSLMNDPATPVDDTVRAAMLASLQKVRAAMERLQGVKVD